MYYQTQGIVGAAARVPLPRFLWLRAGLRSDDVNSFLFLRCGWSLLKLGPLRAVFGA